MKSYNAMTQTYLSAAGLVRVYVRDAATDRPILRQVTQDEAKKLQRKGRIISNPN